MRFRSILLCLLSVAFLATTSLGLHSHVEDHDHGSVSHDFTGSGNHHEHDIYLASELSAAHVAEHLVHGDIDLDSKVPLIAKSSLPSLFLAMAVFCFLVILIPFRRSRIVLSTERPLRPPRRAHLLPPSQAPPCSA